MAGKIHHMTRKYGGKQSSFSQGLQNYRDRTVQQLEAIFHQVVIDIGTSLIVLSPVDTGRFKGNWQVTVGSPANHSLNVYDKVGHETIARITADVAQLTLGQTAYISNQLIYGVPLEYGHSQQAPNGFVRITLAMFDQIVKEAVLKVGNE